MHAASLIIFGARGRAGTVLALRAAQAGYHCLCPSHEELPLQDEQAISRYIIAHPEALAVINCAAISALEACLDDAVCAHQVNAMAPAAMALACRHTGAKLIHLSTDYVLDGRRAGLKDEQSPRRPICVYGASKEEAEWQILDLNEDALIARVSWICGNPDKPSFVEANCLKALDGEPMAAIDDKWSLPTHVDDIARVCLACITRPECRGIIHLCARDAQPLSWYDCAQIALEVMVEQGALPSLPPITRQKLDAVPFFREARPRHTAMDSSKLVEQWSIPMPTAQATLKAAVQGLLAKS